MALEPGKRLGGYCLLKKLARGGMGEIWLAERRAEGGFQKRVVIKTILPPFNEDKEVVELFLREGRIAAGLNHKNIAQVFDLGRQDDVYFLAMEYIEGRDVRHLLIDTIEKGRHLPLNLVLRIAADVCEGLYYAHNWKTPEGQKAPIIHRDISPQNILVAFDGGVKIIDFGIAKAMHLASRTRSGVLKGKYAYMSPEQVRGEELDGRSDIFSLGVVLYEMVTSRRLFKRQSEMSTLEAVVKGEVPPPRRIDGTVPPAIEAVIMKALQVERDQRFADARQMQLALEEVMTKTGLTASAVHLSAYLQENFSRERTTDAERVTRRLEEISGVTEKSQSLQRTVAYRLPHDTSPPAAILTKPVRSRWYRTWFVLAAAGLLALLLAGLWLFAGRRRTTTTRLLASPSPVVSQPKLEPTPSPAVAPSPAFAEPVVEPEQPERQKTENPPTFQLEKKTATVDADLAVTTQQEAEIFIDGRKVGRGRLNRALKPGLHVVEARLPEGGRRIQKINLAPGTKLNLDLSLRKGELLVVVKPYGDIYLGGRFLGQTPLAPQQVYEGRYRLLIDNKELGKNKEMDVVIEAGKKTTINLDLR